MSIDDEWIHQCWRTGIRDTARRAIGRRAASLFHVRIAGK